MKLRTQLDFANISRNVGKFGHINANANAKIIVDETVLENLQPMFESLQIFEIAITHSTFDFNNDLSLHHYAWLPFIQIIHHQIIIQPTGSLFQLLLVTEYHI